MVKFQHLLFSLRLSNILKIDRAFDAIKSGYFMLGLTTQDSPFNMLSDSLIRELSFWAAHWL